VLLRKRTASRTELRSVRVHAANVAAPRSTLRTVPPSKDERRGALKDLYHQARGCTRCPQLAATRNTVVFGSGNADANLMFVGEAPGKNEDEQGLPFVGQAGRLLDQLLGEIGLTRGDVFVANVLKCLRYTALVQLGDGSWERIGRLVRRRYDGTVMSVDTDGRLVPRRVTGWHATPVGGRSIYRLTYRSAKNVGSSKTCIELTGDHPVLTERGYVAVEELRADDRIATGQGLSALARDVVCGTLLGDGSIFHELKAAAVAGGERAYQLHPEVESRVPFERSRVQPGAPRTLYDEVVVEEVTDRPHPDRAFFCLDVEGTHNFVTAGGVVHNCRPPGNRDPHPVEIENCQDYLMRQVALIEPLIICTLGNFATKLLRADPTGITRLHGREEVRVIGTRAVRLYPIFHPAAALYTPANVEVLRRDFGRIPELLALGPPPQPGDAPRPPELPEPEVVAVGVDDRQLGLF
jgi:uracil-DNA glycosylase